MLRRAIFISKLITLLSIVLCVPMLGQAGAYSYLTYYYSSDYTVLYATTVTQGQMLGGSGNSHIYTAETEISGPGGTYSTGDGLRSTGAVPAEYFSTIQSSAQISATIQGDYLITTQGTAYCTAVGRTFYDTGRQQQLIPVQAPYAAKFMQTITQGAAACPAGLAGYRRDVTLQLVDSLSNPIKRAGYGMSDYLSPGIPNALNLPSAGYGPYNTNANGQWPDTYFACSTSCPGATGTSVFTQVWWAN